MRRGTSLALRLAVLAAAVALGGCVSVPQGPSVTTLPGTGKSFDQFRFDESDCRGYANQQVGGQSPNQAATDSGVKSAVVGSALGAVAGAAIDGSSGAGVGAGVGLLMGALIGSGTSYESGYALQRRYDAAFVQCMYAKGHKVPMSSRLQESRQQAAYPPPPPNAPPPPGSRAPAYPWPSTPAPGPDSPSYYPPPNQPPPR